jgi:urea carboxylase
MSPGTNLLDTPEAALDAARRIGFPVMLKATAGGGGIGMRLCHAESELTEHFAAVQRLGKANFKHAGLYIEKYISRARHIEVQIFGDGRGNVVALGERDCSTQRRNQKVIEETPAPNLSDTLRAELFASAVKLGQAVGYQSAGTVEFIFDADAQTFYFLEVNTRLQVEHGVTELVTGIDLVEWMVKQAAGELDLSGYQAKPKGAAIQVRLYAEDPAKNFQPSSGVLTAATFAGDVRVDTWVQTGTEVTAFYDPLIAKVMAVADSRTQTITTLRTALDASHVAGIETNLDYLKAILDHPTFDRGEITTQFLGKFDYKPATIDVLKPGTQTTVQDYPGRTGYWNIGVPPSGPMDGLSFRIANQLVGNPDSAAGLECTVTGPSLRFNVSSTIAIVGADMQATLDGQPVSLGARLDVRAGAVLELRAVKGAGVRTYIAFAGGLDVPTYLGSRSTFTLGKFGGHAGRPLRTGDVLRVLSGKAQWMGNARHKSVVLLTNQWSISVLYGPHGAPDFFLPEDIAMFFSTAWKVHHHSDRTGVRLIGPHPRWRAPMGVKQVCTLQTFTTTRTQWAQSTSPETCRSFWVPMVRASVVLSAPPPSCRPTCGRSVNSRPVTPSASCASHKTKPGKWNRSRTRS